MHSEYSTGDSEEYSEIYPPPPPPILEDFDSSVDESSERIPVKQLINSFHLRFYGQGKTN